MEFEFASPEDETPIRQLLAGCELPNEDITVSHLEHFLVIRKETQLTGVIGLELLEKSALLRSLAVSENTRKRGVASRLVKRAEVYAKTKKIESLYLLTTTAEGFFEKLGYVKTDRSEVPIVVQETIEFKSICPSTAVCMVKFLEADE